MSLPEPQEADTRAALARMVRAANRLEALNAADVALVSSVIDKYFDLHRRLEATAKASTQGTVRGVR